MLEQPGITRYVRFGEEIAELTEKEIDALRRLIASEKELFVQNNSQLKKGARVRIISGDVFDGMEGELVSDEKKGNFAVRINCVSSVITVEVERELMEFIE